VPADLTDLLVKIHIRVHERIFAAPNLKGIESRPTDNLFGISFKIEK
jgi:hypothetical protein